MSLSDLRGVFLYTLSGTFLRAIFRFTQKIPPSKMMQLQLLKHSIYNRFV